MRKLFTAVSGLMLAASAAFAQIDISGAGTTIKTAAEGAADEGLPVYLFIIGTVVVLGVFTLLMRRK